MRSDAPFRDAKTKVMEIRQELSKRSDRPDGNERGKRRKRKRQEKVEPWAKGQSRTRMSFC